jgi:dTDP-4-dehydrorhamnose 3,5-epimerase
VSDADPRPRPRRSRNVPESGPMLPAGVSVFELEPHRDERGAFVELFRVSWRPGVAPAQWNAVASAANVLRGVHVHWRHTDYLTVISGRMVLGLHDLRESSGTGGLGASVALDGDAPAALVIPPGVAHGFYFSEPSVHVYAVSHEWDPDDELGCRWNDPGLGIAWPCSEPLLSERDRSLGTLSELRESVQAALVAH